MATFFGILAIIMWSCLALLGVNTADIPAFQLLSMCFIISALLMFIKRLILKERLFTQPSLTVKQWLVGIAGLFGFHYCYFAALKIAPAIEVSLIAYLWPMLLVLFLATKATRLKALIGSLVGFIGVSFIIVGDNQLTYNPTYVKGYVLAACCALLWSTYSWFFSKSDSNTANSVDNIGWLSLVVAVLSLIVHFQLETNNPLNILDWQFTSKQWLSIILLGLGPVGGAFYLWDIALKKGSKKLLASLSFCTPLISSVILAVVGLNTWSSNILISLSLILLGALISNISIQSITNFSIKNLRRKNANKLG
ncbi:EamA family transporter [Colwellia sp. UCD-KL20]|uniref:DMT family transporter n=1 Tax=Colwellia sp. UCD-KL20 TaxID=1917165 RepID=UPI000970A9A7|nr:EamA family transporter [Colwellia sp. UCD-KL20]